MPSFQGLVITWVRLDSTAMSIEAWSKYAMPTLLHTYARTLTHMSLR